MLIRSIYNVFEEISVCVISVNNELSYHSLPHLQLHPTKASLATERLLSCRDLSGDNEKGKMAEDGHIDFKLYRYDPSMAAAVIFVILFFLVTVLHTYQMIRTRTWIFIPFVLGGVCKSITHTSTSSKT